MCDVAPILLLMYSAETHITVGMLMQVDKLVQLIESPVFIRTCPELRAARALKLSTNRWRELLTGECFFLWIGRLADAFA